MFQRYPSLTSPSKGVPSWYCPPVASFPEPRAAAPGALQCDQVYDLFHVSLLSDEVPCRWRGRSVHGSANGSRCTGYRRSSWTAPWWSRRADVSDDMQAEVRSRNDSKLLFTDPWGVWQAGSPRSSRRAHRGTALFLRMALVQVSFTVSLRRFRPDMPRERRGSPCKKIFFSAPDGVRKPEVRLYVWVALVAQVVISRASPQLWPMWMLCSRSRTRRTCCACSRSSCAG